MTSLERRKVFGRTVVEIALRRPGDNDVIGHTLNHFLCPDERWGRTGPKAAPGPERFLAALAERGWKAPGRSRLFDTRWWDEPRRGLVLEAHHRGYYPRYALLAEKAGSIEVRGTAWVAERGRCLAADVGGFRVVVQPKDGTLQVKTAHSSPVIQPGSGSLTFTLGDLLSRHRRKVPAAASATEEGAALPDGVSR